MIIFVFSFSFVMQIRAPKIANFMIMLYLVVHEYKCDDAYTSYVNSVERVDNTLPNFFCITTPCCEECSRVLIFFSSLCVVLLPSKYLL